MHEVRWTIQKIRQRLLLIAPAQYQARQPIGPLQLQRLDAPTHILPESPPQAVLEPVPVGAAWVARDLNFVLRTTFTIPPDWPADVPVVLYLPLGTAGDFSHPEALAYIDGQPLASCDRHHQEIPLPDALRDGASHTLDLLGWAGQTGFRPGQAPTVLMGDCALAQVHEPCRAFITWARVTLETAEALDQHDVIRARLLNTLDEAFKVLDTRDPGSPAFYASLPAALARLQTGVKLAGAALPVIVRAVGHAHIDVAWLWTLAQTRQKARRTFYNVLSLMRQYPDFHFTQSQPQLYEYVRQDDPALFEQIKAQVRAGRWELTGGMWVEADCNLSGSESLARQFLLGRQYFRRHFGPDADTPILWLPDVFGYAWSLPQLIRQAGLEYFFTIKIGWNQYNRLPYDTFHWQGIDGTQVLTHFSTTKHREATGSSTYNATATPDEALETWRNFQQQEQHETLLMSYGYGDGGGGPTREMVENIDLLGSFPGMPTVQPGRAVDFFRQLEAEVRDDLPVWNGELYLEYHRGTYTTQARNKRANRKAEFLLHDAEFLATLAAQLDPAYAYPAEAFEAAWQIVALNQFHDIIPGSSIGPVYADSMAQYAAVMRDVTARRDDALAAIAGAVGGEVLLVNPTSFTRDDLAWWAGRLADDEHLAMADGQPVATQAGDGGTWIAPPGLPPYSVTALRRVPGPAPALENTLSASPAHLENDLLRVEFNADGDIIRIFDKTEGREALPAGQVANQWQAFEDRPLNWEAWDVDIFYDDNMWLADPATSIRVVESGPLRAALVIERRILNSPFTQTISLAAGQPRLDIETEIDWQERHILLKAAFPVDALSPVATHEIQWGHVQRPTHRNTSWDWARFETAAQKWVDLSEGDYGVSLLNDCKYGHDVRDNVLRLSLLRGATFPDPEADLGAHRFTYSLYPHGGACGLPTIAAAYALNDPALAVSSVNGAIQPCPPLLQSDRPNVIIETIKQAEDGRGIIARLYESQRQRGTATLTCGFPLAGAYHTNLIEDDGEALPLGPDEQSVTLAFRPFEIITLRLLTAPSP